MSTDYTPAIASLAGLIVLFTAMVIVVLRRPSDLSPHQR
jgi:hypothetical protein